jgi:hypothetical protein
MVIPLVVPCSYLFLQFTCMLTDQENAVDALVVSKRWADVALHFFPDSDLLTRVIDL